MNQQNQQKPGNDKATLAEQTRKSEPTNGAPVYTQSDRRPGSKETVEETPREIQPGAAVEEPFTPVPAKDPMKPPMVAAKGDDDIMSKQQSQSMPSTDELKGKWKQQVGAAKIAWGKLTEDELLRVEGHEQKLAGLIQERYAVTRDEADHQVKSFFDKHRSFLPSADEIKGKWKQQVGAAKIAWGKLTEDELLKIEGQEQKLAGLVQERYAVTRDEAEQQVKSFFDKHKS